jgi:hypothetical protein
VCSARLVCLYLPLSQLKQSSSTSLVGCKRGNSFAVRTAVDIPRKGPKAAFARIAAVEIGLDRARSSVGLWVAVAR